MPEPLRFLLSLLAHLAAALAGFALGTVAPFGLFLLTGWRPLGIAAAALLGVASLTAVLAASRVQGRRHGLTFGTAVSLGVLIQLAFAAAGALRLGE